METKEKARKLVQEFIAHTYSNNNNELQCKDKSKKCALIVVDEIIKNGGTKNVIEFKSKSFTNDVKYWQEVKKEIINL